MSKTQSKLGVTLPKIPEVIDVTYATLTTLISGGDLVTGQKYRITDYQTVHTIPGTADTNTGPIEPLIVTAVSSNDLEPIAYSALHPNDIIYYTHTNGSVEFPGSTKGFITRRIDTVQNNDISTDWRYCKYRRYKVTQNVWNSGTTYSVGAVVKSTTTNSLYISRADSNLNNVVTDLNFWLLLPVSDGDYVGITGGSWSIANTTITTDPDDFEDYSLFKNGYNSATVNNTIYDTTLFNTITLVDINNNSVRSIFRDNTILSFSQNIITTGFYNNLVHTSFGSNSISGLSFNNNIVSIKNSTVTYTASGNCMLGNNNSYNAISILVNNIIEGNFLSNILYSMSNSILGFRFSNNQINSVTEIITKRSASAPGFAYNTIKSIYSTGSVIDFTSATHVYNNYTKEIFTRFDGTIKLSYTDNTDTLIVVAPTS